MEKQIEKTMKHEMETGLMSGFIEMIKCNGPRLPVYGP